MELAALLGVTQTFTQAVASEGLVHINQARKTISFKWFLSGGTITVEGSHIYLDERVPMGLPVEAATFFASMEAMRQKVRAAQHSQDPWRYLHHCFLAWMQGPTQSWPLQRDV
eukprot:g60657.t1